MDFDGFQAWLLRRGRSSKTAHHYRHQLERAAAEGGDVRDRVLDAGLSPNTRRLAMAAGRAWAAYASDSALAAELADIRLPPAERVTAKTPLDKEAWKALIQVVEEDEEMRPLERGALLLLCRRGFRVNAIVALKRPQVKAALASGVLIFESKKRRLEYGMRPIREACVLMLTDSWDVVASSLCPRARADRAEKQASDRLTTLLREAAGVAGLHPDAIHPHRLRHTCATHFYRKTKDIVALKQYMQWASINTAARYVGEMDRESLDELAEELLA